MFQRRALVGGRLLLLLLQLPLGSFEVLAYRFGERVVFAQDASTVSGDLLVQGDGLGEATHRTVCACKVVARGEGAGVIFAQDADTVEQDLLEQGDGLGEAARRIVCVCEVVTRGEGVGVVFAQDADTVGQDLLV